MRTSEETPIGITALQDDIAAQLRAASIPQAYIDAVTSLVMFGELARQDHEDAVAIQALAEAQADEEREAYDRWAASTK